MPFVIRGLVFAAHLSAVRWMRVGGVRTNCGRKCGRSEDFNYWFKGFGAHPWILDRRNGLARGIHTRLKAGDRFFGGQIRAEVQWRLNALIAREGFPAYRLVSGANPVGLFRRDGRNEDLTFTQDTSITGQFVQQWKLRAMAQ